MRKTGRCTLLLAMNLCVLKRIFLHFKSSISPVYYTVFFASLMHVKDMEIIDHMAHIFIQVSSHVCFVFYAHVALRTCREIAQLAVTSSSCLRLKFGPLPPGCLHLTPDTLPPQ
jgi:hypothetical protein